RPAGWSDGRDPRTGRARRTRAQSRRDGRRAERRRHTARRPDWCRAVAGCPGGASARLSYSAAVHRVDLRLVLGGDRLALELHRRRQLLAPWQPVATDDRELLYL